ncbi:mediator of RNA polymerase II transcription subunit 23-like [Homalodisca vitripennis]|uniref:mediator of RNA polymerase II transcription subunit 23-like n=1 Tax=Homalodisca vitripennis TaxID=197043 RepID=UPI001EEB5761|nr:mediator of RNA polymerase II transcription subunit 23-like [Homalodisca vitripennis]
MSDPVLTWEPDLDYYIQLVRRIVDTMAGTAHFPATDWRFNEFPNPAAHALYMTCVELMAVPVTPNIVGTCLLDVIAKGYTVIPSTQIQLWINSIGLLMAALPDSYWLTLHDRLLQVVTCPQLAAWPYFNSPFQMFNFDVHTQLSAGEQVLVHSRHSACYVAPCWHRPDSYSSSICKGEAVSCYQNRRAVPIPVSLGWTVPTKAQHRTSSFHCGDHCHPLSPLGAGGQECHPSQPY